ncbi:hypothetical protein [Delftia sp. RIT313]|uniref:hypothetical protein n=1 Tax=Delftia sp. RIT313 TaxID=1468410 RepID=UPI000449ED83|nr:hypothetical protein [Delftia sp. RIT313]EZP56411.1 hypothetical protein BW39_01724 [Delftia sp. RIT313]
MTTVVSSESSAAVIERQTSVVVTREGGKTHVVQQPAPPAVVVTRGIPGPQGPQGPPGGGAGATYTHIQSAAAAVWTVAHNLGRYPSITVVDNLGGQLYPDVRYVDADIVQITHSVPLTGRAYCN